MRTELPGAARVTALLDLGRRLAPGGGTGSEPRGVDAVDLRGQTGEDARQRDVSSNRLGMASAASTVA